jgi:hypothetical protein
VNLDIWLNLDGIDVIIIAKNARKWGILKNISLDNTSDFYNWDFLDSTKVQINESTGLDEMTWYRGYYHIIPSTALTKLVLGWKDG